ncbi:MAG TPA: hypothetical protein VIK18_14960, partial [Pirellulales bacterium]
MPRYCEWNWVNESSGVARCRHCGAERAVKSLRSVRNCTAAGAPQKPAAQSLDCLHRGEIVRAVDCQSCQGKIELPIYSCALHGECSKENHRDRNPDLATIQVCRGCPDRAYSSPHAPREESPSPPQSTPVPKSPPLLAKAANFTRALARDLKNGRKRRSPELTRRIFEQHCAVCPRYNAAAGECAECGCPVNADPEANKIAWASEQCPQKKWPIQTANLIFYILPLRHPDKVWQWHVEQLRRRLSIFDGRRIITIATPGPGERLALDDARLVIDAFGTDAASIEFVLRENDPLHWETPAFRAMLRMIHDGQLTTKNTKDTKEDAEATFYGHAKGVRRAIQDAVRPWSEKMYHHNLDRWAEVREILSAWPCCGIARVGASPLAVQGATACRWHYSGTYFWFRNDALFGAYSSPHAPREEGPRWDKIHDHSHAVEAYLGTQFPISEAYCLAYQDAGQVYSAATWCDKKLEARSTATLPTGELEHVAPATPASGLGQVLRALHAADPRRPRLSDLRVVTAADAPFFTGLQMLVASLRATNEMKLTVFDLGLTAEQAEWCRRQAVDLRLPERRDLIVPRGVDGWQQWSKPGLLRRVFRESSRALWIDADAMVVGGLSGPAGWIAQQPLITRDVVAECRWPGRGGE